MEIEFLNKENQNEWDCFINQSNSAWFRHTTDWLKYSSCCRFDSNTKNFSFMVKQNNEIQAVVPLLTEYSYPELTFDCFAMYGDYTPMPAFANETDVNLTKVFDTIQDKIYNIAQENNIRYGKFIIDPLIKYDYFKDFASFNLMGANSNLKFSTTNIVDLRQEEEVIIRKMRKGHKAAIKQALKNSGYKVEIYDKTNITKDKLLKFKEIHKIDAGRQTRTDKSWDCMYNWINNGNACLIMLWLDEIQDYCCGALIMMYKKSAYYASYGIINSTLLNGHCGYIIQWEAIKYLKAIGIELYETGDNYYSEIVSDNDKKLQEIAKYKRGFRSLEYPKITYKITY